MPRQQLSRTEICANAGRVTARNMTPEERTERARVAGLSVRRSVVAWWLSLSRARQDAQLAAWRLEQEQRDREREKKLRMRQRARKIVD
jgi:hypothetical protein